MIPQPQQQQQTQQFVSAFQPNQFRMANNRFQAQSNLASASSLPGSLNLTGTTSSQIGSSNVTLFGSNPSQQFGNQQPQRQVVNPGSGNLFGRATSGRVQLNSQQNQQQMQQQQQPQTPSIQQFQQHQQQLQLQQQHQQLMQGQQQQQQQQLQQQQQQLGGQQLRRSGLSRGGGASNAGSRGARNNF
jgi:hypothetical protein